MEIVSLILSIIALVISIIALMKRKPKLTFRINDDLSELENMEYKGLWYKN